MDHTGHRERLRRRFEQEGLNGFAPHEALELLLTYALPASTPTAWPIR
jgi:DNA repair protein RadC